MSAWLEIQRCEDAHEPAPLEGHPLEQFTFRDYRLIPGARLLLKHGQPVEIGSRAFDILHSLLRARGALVAKSEIVRAVWPTTFVEESNLRFQIGQLRKALGRDQDLVKTIPGRGYFFAAEPEGGEVAAAAPVSTGPGPRMSLVLTGGGTEQMASPLPSEAEDHVRALLAWCGLAESGAVAVVLLTSEHRQRP